MIRVPEVSKAETSIGELLMTGLLTVALLCAAAPTSAADRPIVIGTKNFTESYLLGELLAQILEGADYTVQRRFGLGGTLISFDALVAGEIDVYVEYTGTVSQAILKAGSETSLEDMNRQLERRGVRFLSPLGFNNTYALAAREERADELGLESISDLVGESHLEVVVSHEFLEREDGWPGLTTAYGFDWSPRGIEHGLAYQALAEGSIDITDVYSTDGELVRYSLRVLDDDKGFFPVYLAAPLVRMDLAADVVQQIDRLAGSIDEQTMQRLNAAVVFEKRTFAQVAREFLAERNVPTAAEDESTGFWASWGSLRENTLIHLQLTGSALIAAILVGVSLGVAVYRLPGTSRVVLYVTGLLQTIPSIALLALMIPVFGIGVVPAIIALFLYSLLPILRNTITGLTTLDTVLERVALAMGLTPWQRLWHVGLPLALPAIMAGIRTAAVISIGTATLAAFIGAGGLGDPIVTGLALNDTGLILQGAVPAALLAVLTELLFEGVERIVLPRHLAASA